MIMIRVNLGHKPAGGVHLAGRGLRAQGQHAGSPSAQTNQLCVWSAEPVCPPSDSLPLALHTKPHNPHSMTQS